MTRLLAFLLFFTCQCLAQTPPVVRFDNLTLRDPLPYQRVFFIKGNRNLFDKTADAGSVKIMKCTVPDCSNYDASNAITSSWWKQGNETDFEFYISKGLEYGEKYKLQFTFYVLKEHDASIKEQIKKELNTELTQLYSRKGAISESQVNQMLKAVAESVIKQNKVGSLVYKDGELEFTRQTTINSNDVDLVGAAKLARAEFNFKRYTQEKENAIEAVKAFSKNNPGLIRNQFPALKLGKKNLFDKDQIKAISDFLNKQTVPDQATLDLMAIYIEKNSNPLQNHAEKLVELRGLIFNYEDVTKKLDASIRNRRELKKQYDDSFQFMLDRLYSTIGDVIEFDAKVDVAGVSEKETIRFDAAAGAGFAFLNPFEDNETQVFSYLAVKYYLTDVDKRVLAPYLTDKWYRRFSILGGFKIGGDLKYKGQSMENVLGVNPVLGASYDINRFISVDLLTIFFKQPSVSPLESTSEVRAAPCLTISVNPDILNRFRAIGSDDKYRVTLPKP